jgi:hypothetical protein
MWWPNRYDLYAAEKRSLTNLALDRSPPAQINANCNQRFTNLFKAIGMIFRQSPRDQEPHRRLGELTGRRVAGWWLRR